MKGAYFYFKIGKMAHFLKKKLVLSIARHLSLSRLPLMTNCANSGYLVNSVCAEPCLRYVGEKKDLANTVSALEILKIQWGGGTNKHNTEAIKTFVNGRKQPRAVLS